MKGCDLIHSATVAHRNSKLHDIQTFCMEKKRFLLYPHNNEKTGVWFRCYNEIK